jgi:hypothetical protein
MVPLNHQSQADRLARHEHASNRVIRHYLITDKSQPAGASRLLRKIFDFFSVKRRGNFFPFIIQNIRQITSTFSGPGSSVGIATGYGLDGPGIDCWWGEIFRTCPDRPWGPPSLLYNGYRVFPGVKRGQGVTLTPHPLLVP